MTPTHINGRAVGLLIASDSKNGQAAGQRAAELLKLKVALEGRYGLDINGIGSRSSEKKIFFPHSH